MQNVSTIASAGLEVNFRKHLKNIYC